MIRYEFYALLFDSFAKLACLMIATTVLKLRLGNIGTANVLLPSCNTVLIWPIQLRFHLLARHSRTRVATRGRFSVKATFDKTLRAVTVIPANKTSETAG